MVSYYDERVDSEGDEQDGEDAEGSEGNYSDESDDEDGVKEERRNDTNDDRDKDEDIGREERQNDAVRRNSSESGSFGSTNTRDRHQSEPKNPPLPNRFWLPSEPGVLCWLFVALIRYVVVSSLVWHDGSRQGGQNW